MILTPPRDTPTDTLLPYSTLFRFSSKVFSPGPRAASQSTSWRPMLPCCAIIVEPSRRATSAEPSPVEGVDGGRPRSEQDFTAKDPVMTKVTNRRNRRRRAIYRHSDVGDGCQPPPSA